MRVRRLGVPGELAEVVGGVPWVSWGVGLDVHGAWADDDSGAVALQRTRPPYGTTLAVLGEPVAAVDLALHVVRCAGVGSVRSITLPQGVVPPPGEVFGPRPAGESWEWMWTSSAPPPQSGEERVSDLDLGAPGAADKVKAFLAQHSPRHSAEPGDPHVRRWLGVRADGGELLASTALYQVVPTVDLMASVAVATQARGQGLGAAIAAAATRRALSEGSPVMTVDLYSDNDAARALYTRLGYRLDQAFTSYPLAH